MSKAVAQAGAVMSDLVAGVHALVTENEKGELLTQRVKELKASANALIRWVEEIQKERS
jgi:hypothetical protein